eukprot:TRINITY_DN264_c0_g1_i4.p1 TRINITY_DN264_c0_g1~~TRINITY_DN264_c0_g1_i4.p1  ORF type:complete len:540 (-),score=139.27 TRINITY_DN264_c0_g1_i4:377-1996(-)
MKVLTPKFLMIAIILVNLVNYMDRGILNGITPNLVCRCSCGANDSDHSGNIETCCANKDFMVTITDPHPICVGPGDVHEPLDASCQCKDGKDPTCITHCASFGPLDRSTAGMLVGAFMGGYIIASPVFAQLIQRILPFQAVGMGLSIWAVSIVVCYLANNFWIMLIARFLSGIGEASFQCVATPYIDDHAPPKSKGLWISALLGGIPIGYAMGFEISGVFSSMGSDGWRIPFLIELVLMAPFIITCFFVKDKLNTKTKPISDNDTTIRYYPASLKFDEKNPPSTIQNVKYCFSCVGFVTACLAYAAYTFTFGGLAFLIPQYVTEQFSISEASGNIYTGIIVLFTGLVGSPVGGIVVDRIGRKRPAGKAYLSDSFLVAMLCIIIGLPFGVASGFMTETFPFFFLSGIAMFFFNGLQGPINICLLESVPAWLRPFAMALDVGVIHILGDVISPSILGWFMDYVKDKGWFLGWSVVVTMIWILWGVLLLGIGFVWTKRTRLRQTKDSGTMTTPLLGATHSEMVDTFSQSAKMTTEREVSNKL